MSQSEKSRISDERGDLLKAIIDNLPLAMFCKDYSDDSGRFVAWNRMAERIWGLKPKQVVGKTDFDFFPKDQAVNFQETDRGILRSMNERFIDEEPVDSPVQGRVCVRTWKVPVTLNNGRQRYLIGISQDLTEIKKLQLALEEQRNATIQASKLAGLGEMAGGIAHEINNPLAIIKGYVNIIEKKLNSGSLNLEDLASMLRNIDQTVSRITAIVDGLRLFSRDCSHEEFVLEYLLPIIEDSLNFCMERIRSKGIAIQLSCSAQNPQVRCQKVQISQVLINLINNAIFALENTKDRKIEIDVSQQEDKIVMAISNNGPTIDQQIAQKIFEPFFTTKDVGKGTGLGLSISKGIVDGHGGSIEFKNLYTGNTAQGVCFYIRLPSTQGN